MVWELNQFPRDYPTMPLAVADSIEGKSLLGISSGHQGDLNAVQPSLLMKRTHRSRTQSQAVGAAAEESNESTLTSSTGGIAKRRRKAKGASKV